MTLARVPLLIVDDVRQFFRFQRVAKAKRVRYGSEEKRGRTISGTR
jgi:hypothetical protein